MKVLIDIIHPGDVHFFRLAIEELQKRGHEVAVTARVKDVAIELLENYGIPFTCLSQVGKGRFDLLCELFIRDFRLWRFCRKFKPDVLTSVSGIFASHIGFLLRKPSIVWDDTEHQKQIHMITWPTATVICSPDCYTKSAGKKHRLYPGIHELAYLHPNRFTPDAEVVRSLGIEPSEKFCIIRMVGWGACHDVGQYGIAQHKQVELIKEISKYARPYITSEGQLPDELEEYKLKIPVHQFHHVLAFSSLCITEGATVASEAAVLGVPVIYVNSLKVGYVDMLEAEYGIIKQSLDMDEIIRLSVESLRDDKVIEQCRAARARFLADKIDMTEYIVKILEEIAQQGR
jgi:predicted glycosyltransferase